VSALAIAPRWLATVVLLTAAATGACSAADSEAPAGALDPAELFEPVASGELVSDGGLSRGVAWGDFDGDGDPDLVVANTINWPQFLYRNDGGGAFSELHEVPPTLAVGWTEGVHWIDYDNDGDLDLFLTQNRQAANGLYRNDGGGALSAVDAGDLTGDEASSRQACWADYDGDGDLDTYVANGGAQDDALYENLGNGRFRRLAEGPWIGTGNEARSCGVGDPNGDGLPDIYVANYAARDSAGNYYAQTNDFYQNVGALRFQQIDSGHFVETGAYSYGVSWIDFDDDGDDDLFVSNIGRADSNWLYENDGAGNLRLCHDSAPVTESRGPSKGHTWGDFDLDGDLDLFVANGTEGTEELPDFDVANFLYLNRGDGRFERVREGPVVTDRHISAGAAFADYDGDGDLDLFVANWGGSDEDNDLYRNTIRDRSGRGWLTLRLQGRQSNRMAIGARVRVKAAVASAGRWQSRVLWAGTGYASQNDPIVHFGLGDAARVDSLEIVWPAGRREVFTDVEANRVWLGIEGEGLRPLPTIRDR